jgi:hypothetical protein
MNTSQIAAVVPIVLMMVGCGARAFHLVSLAIATVLFIWLLVRPAPPNIGLPGLRRTACPERPFSAMGQRPSSAAECLRARA